MKVYHVEDVITAQCNLEPLTCKLCESTEVTYHQYIGDAHCADCDRWQLEDETMTDKSEAFDLFRAYEVLTLLFDRLEQEGMVDIVAHRGIFEDAEEAIANVKRHNVSPPDSEEAQAFDRAFSKDDDTLALLKRVLGCFALDMFAEQRRYQESYTVRLWDQGETVAESSGEDLETVLQDIDRTAAAIANYG